MITFAIIAAMVVSFFSLVYSSAGEFMLRAYYEEEAVLHAVALTYAGGTTEQKYFSIPKDAEVYIVKSKVMWKVKSKWLPTVNGYITSGVGLVSVEAINDTEK